MACSYSLLFPCEDCAAEPSSSPASMGEEAPAGADRGRGGDMLVNGIRGVKEWGSTPVEKAVDKYLAKLPAKLKRKFLTTVRIGLEDHIGKDAEIMVGSACSGSDIGFICTEVVVTKVCGLLGIDYKPKHVFACEVHLQKQAFLRTQFHPQYLFANVSDLKNKKAFDVISEQQVYIPMVLVFKAGFSCKSRTTLSSKAPKHLDCVQRNDPDAETAVTFDGVRGYVERARPAIVILENVQGLASKSSADADSDADFVVKSMLALGYWCKMFQFDCEHFGSCATRVRLYFVAVLIDQDLRMVTELAPQFDWLPGFFESMSIGPFDADNFILTDNEQFAYCENMCPFADIPSTKAARKDEAWQREHCDYFREHGIAWPPEITAQGTDFMEISPNNFYMRGSLLPRAAELLYYLHIRFPYTGQQIEFVDVAPTMARVVQHLSDGTSPWKTIASTITGGSFMCVRFSNGDSTFVRPLCAVEYFSLIGWDPRYFKPITETEAIIKNLSGNAFSAFAIMPTLMLAFAALGVKVGAATEIRDAIVKSYAPVVTPDCYDSDEGSDSPTGRFRRQPNGQYPSNAAERVALTAAAAAAET